MSKRHPQYDYDQIKGGASCLAIAREIGLNVDRNGRCAATWRGGDNPTAVSINDDGWHDFVTEQSGSVIDLVANVKYGDNPVEALRLLSAQEWLGDRLGLTPTAYTADSLPGERKTRYRRLSDEGYVETKRYDYTDETGALVQQVIRMEHPDPGKGKQFLQCDATGRWSVKHVTPVLYNLPVITAAEWAVVVEGEKDADTLIAMGFPATTCVAGAKKWQDSYSNTLAGKTIWVLPDNDEAGKLHLNDVAKSLRGKAKAIKVLTISSLPKGDVTDWVEKEGGTPEKLRELLATAPEWEEPDEMEIQRARAKDANTEPLRNYVPEPIDAPNGKSKTIKTPRLIGTIVDDVHNRFCGFPRRIGGVLFDQDHDSGLIEHITSTAALFAWMGRKASQHIDWTRGDAMVGKEELFAALHGAARRYESISKVPDFPRRDDTYYSHPPLPDPTPGHTAFARVVEAFAPASSEDHVLIKAFLCAPLFYRRGIPRPMWVIDSVDGPGTGKTTLAECCAELYASSPIAAGKQDLFRGMDDLVKRIVSSSGRLARILFLDNITGDFRSEELAGLVTRKEITGKAPYGRGEETRPNNLTYVVTANSASLDDDLAIRSFFIFLKRARITGTWKTDLENYIDSMRLQILADMLDILGNHPPCPIEPRTRFPEFETNILHAMCADDAEFARVVDHIMESRDNANHDSDIAAEIADKLRVKLVEAGVHAPDSTAVFIHSNVAKDWLSSVLLECRSVVGTVKNLARIGHLKEVNPKVERYPKFGNTRGRRGIMWNPKGIDEGVVLTIGGTGKKPVFVGHEGA